MAAYTDTLGFYKGTAAYGAHADKKLGWLEDELDFTKIVAARSAASATALAAADTLQVLQVPANSLVLHAGLEVTEVEATNTPALSTWASLAALPLRRMRSYDDGASNALAVLHTALAAPVKIGSSADTIDLLINTAAPTNCVIRVFALVVDCN